MAAKDRHASRRNKLISKIKKADADALLVTSENNVTYLTGFSGDSSYLIIGPNITLMISDTRYTTQIEEECSGVDVYIRTARDQMADVVGKLAKKAGIRKLGFESHIVTVKLRDSIDKELKATELVPTSDLVEELRSIKDSYEIAETRLAVRYAERGFETLRSNLRRDLTELQVAHDLEHSMRTFGAERAGFDPIVAVGNRAALPHARPGKDTIGSSDFVLVDWGAETTSNYRSDLTRVLVTGRVLPKLRKIYEVVLLAQKRAIAAIRPGAECVKVDEIARSTIADAGYGKKFGHGVGHSIGLQIHEFPRFSPISDEVLKPGMILTVEPGIYFPGWGGVRIEDDVLVTRDGHEVLSTVPKEFDQQICDIR
ncbi:MAG: aminopeptidase [Planctomycetaceae bacterium]|nr:aminopeptidase [Planctomycetaceae bacterium]